jgi:hypothetical protein
MVSDVYPNMRKPYLPEIKVIGINVLESAWLLIPDYPLESTDAAVLCKLDRKDLQRASAEYPTVELEIDSWRTVSN